MNITLRNITNGSEIKRLRERLNISQTEFAALLGMSQQSVSSLERSTHLRRMTAIAVDLLFQLIELKGKGK